MSSSGALSAGKMWTCWRGARGGHSNDQRAGTALLRGKAERVGAVQPGEKKAAGRPYSSLPVLERSLSEIWGQTFKQDLLELDQIYG